MDLSCTSNAILQVFGCIWSSDSSVTGCNVKENAKSTFLMGLYVEKINGFAVAFELRT